MDRGVQGDDVDRKRIIEFKEELQGGEAGVNWLRQHLETFISTLDH